jgi:hypothetical protein
MGPTTSGLIAPDDTRWTSALAKVPHDVYHTPAYVEAEARRIGARAVGFLAAAGPRSFLLPLLLRPGSSLPTGMVDGRGVVDAVSPYGYPGILLAEPGPPEDGFVDDCVDLLGETLSAADACSAFIRMHPLLNAGLSVHLRRHALTPVGTTVSIDLEESKGRLWADLSRGHANAVSKARRLGYSVQVTRLRDRFEDFWVAYQDTLNRLGASSEGQSREHLRALGGLDASHVAVAMLEEQVAAAYALFEHQGIVQMHLGGPRSAFMRCSPSHLLIHSVCLWAGERGDRVVHLGGGVGGSSADKLFGFKAGFSPCRHPYDTLRLVTDPSRYEELVRRRASSLGLPADALSSGGFFPAYRASRSDPYQRPPAAKPDPLSDDEPGRSW